MISLIIPAYNEEKRIAKTLKDYISYLKNNKINFELICINDGNDKTAEIVKSFRNKCKLKQLVFSHRLGKGGAILKGFDASHGDIIAFADADGSCEPSELLRLIDFMKSNNLDGAIGCRWCKGSKVKEKQPISRRIASRGFNFMTRAMFGLHFKDTQCGLKVFKTKCIKSIRSHLGITNFAFDVDLLFSMKKRGFSVRQLPIEWSDKKGSTLKMKKTVPIMFVSIFRLWILDTPLRYFARFRLFGHIYSRLIR